MRAGQTDRERRTERRRKHRERGGIEREGQTDRDRRTERRRKQRERGQLREGDRRSETDGRTDR